MAATKLKGTVAKPMRLAALAATMLTGACALLPVNIDPPAPDTLAERFELIAFYNELSSEVAPLARWREGPIRVGTLGADASRYGADIALLADEFSTLTGAHFELVGPNQTADIVILMDTRQNIVQQFERVPALRSEVQYAASANCFGIYFAGSTVNPYTIESAVISIRRASAQPTRRCLAQELTQVLGLPNDIDDPDGTVFASGSTRTTLSASDRNIVRILYDRRLQPGMTRTEAMPIVRRIAAELEAQQATAE